MKPGDVVGRSYVIERLLGRGGMGAVYLAQDRQLGRRVAIKALLATGAFDASGGHQRRFAVEAQAVARLRHPGIVSVHEVGVHEGQPFMVMDLVDGHALDEHLAASGPMAPREAAAIVLQVAQAVVHAHEAGILHRDLKPANVLLDKTGRALLTDFGIARELSEERERLTRTGDMLGTPAYMPPEQARGAQEIDVRADVYGLGATLYATLTAQPPFDGGGVIQIISQVLKTAPRKPSGLNPDLDEGLEAICLMCLAKDPADRYATAAALADDLRRYLAGEPLVARPPSRSSELAAGVARKKLPIVGGLGGFVLLCALAYAASQLIAPDPGPPPVATTQDPKERAGSFSTPIDAGGSFDYVVSTSAVTISLVGQGPWTITVSTRSGTTFLTPSGTNPTLALREDGVQGLTSGGCTVRVSGPKGGTAKLTLRASSRNDEETRLDHALPLPTVGECIRAEDHDRAEELAQVLRGNLVGYCRVEIKAFNAFLTASGALGALANLGGRDGKGFLFYLGARAHQQPWKADTVTMARSFAKEPKNNALVDSFVLHWILGNGALRGTRPEPPDLESARVHLERALEQSGDAALPRLALAACYTELGRWRDAEALILPLLALYPADAAVGFAWCRLVLCTSEWKTGQELIEGWAEHQEPWPRLEGYEALGDSVWHGRVRHPAAARRAGRALVAWTKALPELSTTFGNSRAHMLHVRALALSEGREAALQFLHAAMRDVSANMNPKAFALLRQDIDSLEDGPVELTALLGSDDARVREKAAVDLRLFKDEAALAIPSLEATLADADPRVRRAAALALGAIGPKATGCVPKLVALLADPDEHVRCASAKALRPLGPDPARVLPPLIGMLEDSVPNARRAAAYTLAELGPSAAPATKALIETLAHENEFVRAGVAHALGAIGPGAKASLPALRARLEDGDPDVRKRAAAAIQSIETAP